MVVWFLPSSLLKFWILLILCDCNNPICFSRNDKLASKLLNNLGKLQDMSSTIQKRMQAHDDEIKDKQKKE